MLNINSPINLETVQILNVGTKVLIYGIIYTARDAAHQRLIETLERGEKLPFDLNEQTIYYMGPAPARPNQVIGAAGPTTSSRMDKYTPQLLAAGIRSMIGKGDRSPTVREALQRYKAVYLSTIGGAGALIAKSIKQVDVVAYADLGTEAIHRLRVEAFPAIVANDIYGNDLFEIGKAEFQRRN
jgi:fumarate hydratase subunit beta